MRTHVHVHAHRLSDPACFVIGGRRSPLHSVWSYWFSSLRMLAKQVRGPAARAMPVLLPCTHIVLTNLLHSPATGAVNNYLDEAISSISELSNEMKEEEKKLREQKRQVHMYSRNLNLLFGLAHSFSVFALRVSPHPPPTRLGQAHCTHTHTHIHTHTLSESDLLIDVQAKRHAKELICFAYMYVLLTFRPRGTQRSRRRRVMPRGRAKRTRTVVRMHPRKLHACVEDLLAFSKNTLVSKLHD